MTEPFPLSYCPSGRERIQRLRSLYERRAQDRIFAKMEVPSRALEEFGASHAAGYSGRPDVSERIEFWDAFLAERQQVEDDSIPCAYLSELDQGLYGGIAGGSIQYMVHPENGWISSMVPPISGAWDAVDRLAIDRDSEPYRFYLKMLDAFLGRAQGRFGISHFILIDGLNFVYELLGATNTYLAVAEEPEKVKLAVDFAYLLNVHVQKVFFGRVPLLEGGTCSNMAGWVPGRIVSESVDPFHMTSVAYFERWGREPVERILGTFDGGVIHIHGNGRHLLPVVRTIDGLKAVSLLNDRGYPRAIAELRRLKKLTGDLPLVVDLEFSEFVEAFERHELPGGVLYSVNHAPDAATANRWMDRVREYRA